MAARDRFGTLGGPAQSTLQRYIQSACDPSNYEPNLALDLEIADLINSKKGNAPREAAMTIVNYINHRNPNVALLALTLLDICVKNCGYPFHLQISTKDFLNELVRRFPERPPLRPSRVQLKILEAIEEWRQTICQTSRYKEDLGFIRDMHRLLSFKGYMFPEVRREDAAVLNPSDNLKSADEMEEEERAAQSAKLQELIRRGGPEDLQEANRLMKVMAGFDTKHRTDYRAKAAEEVSKIQQKAKILEEMLQGYNKDDKIAEGDLFEELATALRNAQPKIQKMCEEESEDTEAVAKLFEINDSIHRTLERYTLIKKGDLEGASKIPKGTLGTTTGVTKTADNELSLIDLDVDSEPNLNGGSQSNTAADSKTDSLEDDLLGLSFQGNDYGKGGSITLGPSTQSVVGPNSVSTNLQSLSSVAPRPQGAIQSGKGAMSNMAWSLPLSGSAQSSQATTPTPPVYQQQPSTQASVNPFASINSAAFGQTSPAQVVGTAQGQTNSGDNEEWTFASSLPETSALPASSELTVTNSAVNIVFSVTRPSSAVPSLSILARFSNTTSQPISDLAFQVAVTKGFSLKLQPQSGVELQPHQRHGISQTILISRVDAGRGSAAKLRWKLSYRLGGEARQEEGDVSGLGLV